MNQIIYKLLWVFGSCVEYMNLKSNYFLTLHDETADNELEMWKNSCESSSLW